MGEQTKQKQKLIHFKPGIRKDFFKAVIFMMVFMAVMLGAMMIPGFGLYNGMAFGMAAVGILMTLSNDLTLEPVKNGLILIASNIGLNVMAFIGYGLFPEYTAGRVILMTAATLVTFFLSIFLLTSEERNSMYMPVLMSFSLMIFYNSNTTGMTSSTSALSAPKNIYFELLLRIAIYVGAALVALGVNFLLYGRKFRKKIRAALDGAIHTLENQCKDVYEGTKDVSELMKQGVIIDKTLSGIEGAMGTKMSIKSHWQDGHDLIRTITILKRINHTITNYYVRTGKHIDKSLYDLLISMLETINSFEQDKITAAEMEQKMDVLYHRLTPDSDYDAILESVSVEMEDFLEGQVHHEPKSESRGSVGAWLRGHISSYNLIFALKNAILAALGVFAVELVNTIAGHRVIPMAYMFPLYVGITAQPYLELNKDGVKKRIINTIYAGVLVLISFAIPFPAGLSWIHFIILIALSLIGDMFFQFDFMTMMGTMFAIIMNIVTQPDQLYSYTFWRVGYIVVICLLVQVVDMFIFPKRIPQTLQKQLQASLAINDKLRYALANRDCDYNMLHDILMEKRKADQCLRATNKFANNQEINAYLLADEEWMNRLTMMNHRLKTDDLHLGNLRDFIHEHADQESVRLTKRQKNLLTSFDEILEDLHAAEKLAAEFGKEKAEPVGAAS